MKQRAQNPFSNELGRKKPEKSQLLCQPFFVNNYTFFYIKCRNKTCDYEVFKTAYFLNRFSRDAF